MHAFWFQWRIMLFFLLTSMFEQTAIAPEALLFLQENLQSIRKCFKHIRRKSIKMSLWQSLKYTHTHTPKHMLNLGQKPTYVSDSCNITVCLKDTFPKLAHTFQTNSDCKHRFSPQKFKIFTSWKPNYGAN